MARQAQGDHDEENYWPGFVDALTTMTMILTFILMVLGIVVFSLSQSVSKAFLVAIADAAKVETQGKGMNSVQIKDAVIARLQKLNEAEAGQKGEVPDASLKGDFASSARMEKPRPESTSRPIPDGDGIPAQRPNGGPAQVTLAEPDIVPFARPTFGGVKSPDQDPSGELPAVALLETDAPEKPQRRSRQEEGAAGPSVAARSLMPGMATLESPAQRVGPDADSETGKAQRVAAAPERARPETTTALDAARPGLAVIPPGSPSRPGAAPPFASGQPEAGGPLMDGSPRADAASVTAPPAPVVRPETLSRTLSDANALPQAEMAQRGPAKLVLDQPEGPQRPTTGGPLVDETPLLQAGAGGAMAQPQALPESRSRQPADGRGLPASETPAEGPARFTLAEVQGQGRPTSGGPLAEETPHDQAAPAQAAAAADRPETQSRTASEAVGLPATPTPAQGPARLALAEPQGQLRPTTGGPLPDASEPPSAAAASAPWPEAPRPETLSRQPAEAAGLPPVPQPAQGPARLASAGPTAGASRSTMGGPLPVGEPTGGHPASSTKPQEGLQVAADSQGTGRAVDASDGRSGPALAMLDPEPGASEQPRAPGNSDQADREAGVARSLKAPPQKTPTKEIVSTLEPDLRKPGAGADVTTSSAQLSIRFRPKAITLGEAERATLRRYLTGDEVKRDVALRVEALTYTGIDGFSDERRLSYLRMMTIRNELLSAGVPAERIKVQLRDSASSADSNLVKLFAGN